MNKLVISLLFVLIFTSCNNNLSPVTQNYSNNIKNLKFISIDTKYIPAGKTIGNSIYLDSTINMFKVDTFLIKHIGDTISISTYGKNEYYTKLFNSFDAKLVIDSNNLVIKYLSIQFSSGALFSGYRGSGADFSETYNYQLSDLQPINNHFSYYLKGNGIKLSIKNIYRIYYESQWEIDAHGNETSHYESIDTTNILNFDPDAYISINLK